MARWRPYLLGFLGLAAITFPFLWLKLEPNFSIYTMGVSWAPAHGLQFFSDLSPVFIIALIGWLIVRAQRYFGLSAALNQNKTAAAIGTAWDAYWPWLAMPFVLSFTFWFNPSTLGLMTYAGIYMLLALGLNITVGMTGLLVLGYAGFYGFGAYLFALGQENLPVFPWWVAAPIAFFCGGGVGYLLGLPCLRLRGDYLAIVTLGFALAAQQIIRNLDLTHADKGISRHGDSTFHGFALGTGVVTNGQMSFIYTALILFAAVFLVQRIQYSPIGRAWMAIRENEVAAASLGVPVVQMKLLAFSLSAAIAALAGVVAFAKDGFVSPAICDFQQSVMVLAMVILGGLGNNYGALLGAALLYLVPEYMKLLPSMIQHSPTLSAVVPTFFVEALRNLSDYRWLVFGAVMVVMMLYRPQGLLGSSRRKTEMLHR